MNQQQRPEAGDDGGPVMKAPPMPPMDPRDKAFLDANEAALAAQYPDEWVVAFDGKLAGHGPELFDLADEVHAITGYGGGLFWFTGVCSPEFGYRTKRVLP